VVHVWFDEEMCVWEACPTRVRYHTNEGAFFSNLVGSVVVNKALLILYNCSLNFLAIWYFFDVTVEFQSTTLRPLFRF
jgi:hypothetical protein